MFPFKQLELYLMANPINKFMMIMDTRRRNSTKANWVVGVPLSTFPGTNRSPKLNSPTIIAKVHINAVKGSPKCSYSNKYYPKHSNVTCLRINLHRVDSVLTRF